MKVRVLSNHKIFSSNILLINIAFLLIAILTFSCGQEEPRLNTISKDKCILIELKESTDCEVLEFYYTPKDRFDSICILPPPLLFESNFPEYYPKEKIFHVDNRLNLSALSVLMFWYCDYVEEISSFPFVYKHEVNQNPFSTSKLYYEIKIDSLQYDSILWFVHNDNIYSLNTNKTFSDTLTSIRIENKKKIKSTTILTICNYGFIKKDSIFNYHSLTERSLQYDGDSIPNYVEEMPEFKGGEEKLIKYLKENVRYLEKTRKDSISGKVYVKFIVDSTGKINNVTLLRGLDPILDSASIKLIRSMPNWIPGKHHGEKISVKVVLPINFKLVNY